MLRKKLPHFLVFSVFLTILIFCPSVFAAFNLIAQPTEGGFDLRFQRISPTDFKVAKEMTLRVTSDIGKQYRIEQEVIQPLTTSSGTQISDDQFQMYALVNSNSKGTLIYRPETPVSQFDRILYSSDASGADDSFKLVYTITPKEVQIPGSYYGRMAYILVPIDSTQQQVVVNINVYVELAGGATPVVEIETVSGVKRLSLSSKGMGFKKEPAFSTPQQVSIKVHGPLGAQYRVYQNLENAEVRSNEGEEFDLSNVLFSVTGGDQGMVTRDVSFKGATSKQLLYSSDSRGSEDAFTVTYTPSKDFRLQKAGIYRGKLDFIIETDRPASFKTGVFETLDLEIEIVPVFEIYCFSGGVEGVALVFGEINYRKSPKTSESEIYIESNLGKPYQAIQKVAGPMADEKGEKIPSEDFTAQVKDLETIELPKLYLKDATAVKEGENIIFASGPSGESAHFKVVYSLTLRPETKSGNYSTKIGYSLVLN